MSLLVAFPSEETINNENPSAGTKRPNQNCDEPQPSDDDDFPDEQEIFKANGLLSLKKNLNGPVSFSEQNPGSTDFVYFHQQDVFSDERNAS